MEFTCKCGLELLVLGGQHVLDCPVCGQAYTIATTHTIHATGGDCPPIHIREHSGAGILATHARGLTDALLE